MEEPDSALLKFYNGMKSGGIAALIPMLKQYAGDMVKEILLEALKTIGMELLKKGIAKLAMLATPVSGILMALKAVYDLIQFIRQNISAISDLIVAVTNTLGMAAMGDSSGVAKTVYRIVFRFRFPSKF